jgi:hypothetical protein
MTNVDTNSEALALSALAWTLGEESRAERFLSLTGLTPETLRARVGERSLLAAVLGFLEAHEPDLVACAEALEIKPDALVAARRRLEA